MELATIDHEKLAGLIAAELRKPLQEWLAPKEAAVYCDLKLKTLEEYRRLGGGPAYSKVGRHVRYARTDLEAWMRGQANG